MNIISKAYKATKISIWQARKDKKKAVWGKVCFYFWYKSIPVSSAYYFSTKCKKRLTFKIKSIFFPSYEYDGPFSGLAKKIHVEQYQYMRTVLGSDFFYQNPDSRIRSTRGLIYLKGDGAGRIFHPIPRIAQENRRPVIF